jgi:hypothetical protein
MDTFYVLLTLLLARMYLLAPRSNLQYAYSRLFHCSYFLVPFMPGVGFLFADNQISFDTMKRWLVHTCKEMYASEVDSTGKRWVC